VPKRKKSSATFEPITQTFAFVSFSNCEKKRPSEIVGSRPFRNPEGCPAKQPEAEVFPPPLTRNFFGRRSCLVISRKGTALRRSAILKARSRRHTSGSFACALRVRDGQRECPIVFADIHRARAEGFNLFGERRVDPADKSRRSHHRHDADNHTDDCQKRTQACWRVAWPGPTRDSQGCPFRNSFIGHLAGWKQNIEN